jgi:hypothetical protein
MRKLATLGSFLFFAKAWRSLARLSIGGSLHPKLAPELLAEAPRGPQVDLSKSDLLPLIQRQGYPFFQDVEAAEPNAEVVFVDQSGRLDNEASAPMLVVHPAAQTQVEIGRVDADHGDEVLKSTGEGR